MPLAYAVAPGLRGSAVVVYLRALYYPQGFAVPLVPMPLGMALEIGREAAPLIMFARRSSATGGRHAAGHRQNAS